MQAAAAETSHGINLRIQGSWLQHPRLGCGLERCSTARFRAATQRQIESPDDQQWQRVGDYHQIQEHVATASLRMSRA
jgi:hypothetical protein